MIDDFPDFEADIALAENNFPKSEKLPEAEEAEPESNLGLFPDISNEVYHAGRGISSSELKYAVKAMALYQAYKNGVVSFAESEAMRLGTAVHKMVLEAYDFGNEIVIGPKFGATKIEKEAKKAFYEENKGMTIITADQYEKCRGMTDSLLSLPEVDKIFQSGDPELSGYYIDNGGDETFIDGSYRGTNMLCKYRPDWRNNWCLPDVKTTTDISKQAFMRTIHKFGYHISAAHYLEGDRILAGQKNRTADHAGIDWHDLPDDIYKKQSVFLAVESNPPYLATMYILDPESLQLGKEIRRIALNEIKKARDTNEYPLYNNGFSQSIGVPQFAFNDSIAKSI